MRKLRFFSSKPARGPVSVEEIAQPNGPVRECLDSFYRLVGRVPVVALQPLIEALAEVVVEEHLLEVPDLSRDLGHRVRESLEADQRRLEEPHDVPRGHRVLEPPVTEEVLAPAVVRDGVLPLGGHLAPVPRVRDLLDLGTELGRHALIGVEVEDPPVLELDVLHRPVLVRTPPVVRTLEPPAPGFFGDAPCVIGAQAVEHNDVVSERHTLEQPREVGLFVQRLDEDGNGHGRTLAAATRTTVRRGDSAHAILDTGRQAHRRPIGRVPWDVHEDSVRHAQEEPEPIGRIKRSVYIRCVQLRLRHPQTGGERHGDSYRHSVPVRCRRGGDRGQHRLSDRWFERRAAERSASQRRGVQPVVRLKFVGEQRWDGDPRRRRSRASSIR
jgi:hypothetical protein